MRQNGHFRKAVKACLTAVICFAVIVIPAFCFPEHALCGSQSDPEVEAVMQAARNYLDAEVRGDYPVIYACFAPSSIYTQTSNYEQYLADARSAQEHLVKYRIVAITYIKKNENKLTFSAVDKIAEVEVDVTFLHNTTKHRSEVNIGFIFFKEGGKWYKS